MGNATGTVVSSGKSVFTPAQKKAIVDRFNTLDKSEQGFVSKKMLLSNLSPVMAAHPLVEDLLDVVIRRRMRADGTIMVQTKKARWLAKQSVYPTDFIVFASLFSPKQTLSRKLTALFEVFDVDADGYATEEDVARVFRTLYGLYYDNAQLSDMAHACLVQCDIDADGQLSFREFLRLVSKTDLVHTMSRLL